MLTPGQFEVPGQTPITDPLQLQFMTQGQMGYMPQAQFLTPYQYGNFRTMPTPDVMGYASQETGIIQNYLIANRGSDPFGILPAYTFNTYNPAINARQQQVVAQRRMEDARAAWAPLAADLGINIGMGVFGGIPGMVASMLMPDWLSPSEMVAQRRKSTREIQNLSTSKIFTGPDRDEAYGLGFGYKQARGIDRYIRESAADDALMKEGDWRDMLSLGMKYGQFDYANNAEQYKRILKNMRGNMTTMMEVIGSTDFEEIMKNMKRMQDMGAQQEHYMNIARKEQQYARVTGLSHQEMVDTYGQSGALTFQQAGLNAMQGSVTAMGNAALATYLQRTGAIDPTLMAHFGGVSGMAQQMTQASAKAHKNIQDTLLAGMMNDDFTGLAEGLDLVDIVNDPRGMDKLLAGAGRANTIGKQRRFNVNRHKAYADLQEKYGPEVVEALMAKMAGQRLTGSEGDDALFYGYQALGYSSEEAEARLAMVKSGGIWEMQKQAKEEQRRKAKEEREQRNSPLNKLGRWFEGMKEWLGQGVYSVLDRAGIGASDARKSANLNDASFNGRMSSGNSNDDLSDLATTDLAGQNADMIRAKFQGKEQNYVLNIAAHPEKLGELTAYLETGTEGMSQITAGAAGRSYGKWQMNDEQGSLKNWMRSMAGDKENPLGAQIVGSILRAGGATSLDQVDDKTFWKQEAVQKEYKRQVAEHGDYMENNQRDFVIKEHYGGALDELSRAKRGDIISQLESSNVLKEVVLDLSVQHGAHGARQVLEEAYRPGMSNRELFNAIMDARLKRYIRKKGEKVGRELYESRVVKSLPIYGAMFDQEEGVVRGGAVGGSESFVPPADATIASLASSAVKQHTDYAKNVLHVGYGLGEKGGTRRAVAKEHRDQSKKDGGKGRLMEEGKYYADCSGWVGESLYNIATTANANADYQVFDDSIVEAFDTMSKNRTSEQIIDWFEDNDRVWVNGEITDDLLREQGTMVIGVDTGEQDFEKGQKRRHGIDHIVMTFVDPATGELMVSESTGSGGVTITPWKEWKKRKHIKMVAGSVTRFAKTKGGERGQAGAKVTMRPQQPQQQPGSSMYMQPDYQHVQTVEGRTQEQIDEDSRNALDLQNAERRGVLNQQVEDDSWLFKSRMQAGTAVNMARDIAMGNVEQAKDIEKTNLAAVSGMAKDLQAASGREASGLNEDKVRDIVSNYSGQMSSSIEAFSGTKKLEWLKEEKGADSWTYDNIKFDQVAKDNPYYNVFLDIARESGMSEDEASRWAFESMLDESKLSTIRQIYVTNKGFGHEKELQNISDTALSLASNANKYSNKIGEERQKGVLKETRNLLFGGETGFFESLGFEDKYNRLIQDKSSVAGAKYTRGELAEKIPAIAGLLAELENCDEAIARGGPNVEDYKEQRGRIIRAIYNLSEAYGIKKEDVDRVIETKGGLAKRLESYNFEIGRRNSAGLKLSKTQLDIATDIGNTWKSDTKGAYTGHMGNAFKERKERVGELATNRKLNSRFLLEGIRSQDEREQIDNIYNIAGNYGGMQDFELQYFGDKEKITDWRADQVIQTFRNNKMGKTADLFEKARKEGRTPDKKEIVAAMAADGKDLNQKHDLVASEYTYNLDQKSKEQANLERNLGPGGVPMGQLSAAADGALQELPGVLRDLNITLQDVRNVLSEKFRINANGAR